MSENQVEVHRRLVTWSEPLFDAILASKAFVEMPSEGQGLQRKRVFATHRMRRVIKVGMNQMVLLARSEQSKKEEPIYTGYTIHDKLLNKFLND